MTCNGKKVLPFFNNLYTITKELEKKILIVFLIKKFDYENLIRKFQLFFTFSINGLFCGYTETFRISYKNC